MEFVPLVLVVGEAALGRIVKGGDQIGWSKGARAQLNGGKREKGVAGVYVVQRRPPGRRFRTQQAGRKRRREVEVMMGAMVITKAFLEHAEAPVNSCRPYVPRRRRDKEQHNSLRYPTSRPHLAPMLHNGPGPVPLTLLQDTAESRMWSRKM